MKKYHTMDGNEAAAHVAYAFTEVCAIYPITPSSPMAELVDLWSAHGRKNLFDQVVEVVEMQSEIGAAGALHGSLAAGALTTTFTASQGLLLMIPNLYKIAGELLPGVIHVSARAIAAHALSIFGDHQDVMACRQTGVAMLASSNVQEVMDLACIAHLAALKASVPFLHFFDGFRTSHEYQKIETVEYDLMAQLLDLEALERFRRRGLNPERPVTRGSAQNPDIYFQGREAANPFYAAVPGIVQEYMDRFHTLTRRRYGLFDYYGHPQAEEVVVAMGSVCDTLESTVDHLRKQGRRVGVVKVRLYRPFSESHFLEALPPTVRKIAVLDRTKEPGSPGEPLYLDVVKACQALESRPTVVGGRYGLGSKDTTPAQIAAVFHNLQQDQPKDRFTIGINDDLSFTSLPVGEPLDITPEGTIACKFWGLGSDGTVGANQEAIRIIGDHTDLHVQAYFYYDSKKSGGTTVSHLRFGKEPLKAPYLVDHPDYIACHNKAFVHNYDLLKGIKPGGIFVLNCPWEGRELEENLPAATKRTLARKKVRFYTIDAIKIAGELGLGNRINMVMQAVFFKLAQVIPVEEALSYLKSSVETLYGRKGKEIVEMNVAAIDRGAAELKEIKVPPEWAELPEEDEGADLVGAPPFVAEIQVPMQRMEGDDLPVSALARFADGTFPNGTTAYEKRGIAVTIPQWQLEKCIQCNQCSFVCPHAVIRPYLLDGEELARAPKSFHTKPAVGKGLEGLGYRIQLSPLDCTGCGNCADVCPAPGKALIMQPADQEIAVQRENWLFAQTVSNKAPLVDWRTLKNSQFRQPLFEFHGACPGCGETPYLRLLTQLFGEQMIIANATGCSSIYSASAPSFPYTVTPEGKGPAWANSLFEDNAEFGLGMRLATKQLRQQVASLVEELLTKRVSPELKAAGEKWLQDREDTIASAQASRELLRLLEREVDVDPLVEEILQRREHLAKKSQWIIGGDGWAYDIGFGGLDHVLALGDDVNILVLDTEVYSNTGGQSSKATPKAAVAKFAASGKRVGKKDLGLMAMTYGYVYVAQIAMGANMNHTIRTILEAESYPGPSLIIAYSPCINHGIRTGMGTSIMQEKRAVEAGYWHLYRYNPLLKAQGKNPFSLDSKDPTGSFRDFLLSEIRYSSLGRAFPEEAEKLFSAAQEDALGRLAAYRRLAEAPS
ncbi:pyruvate:ferredoxin (flavodoxin) oxidoreductase [Candidatus Darwinibacter acetoxidans]|jgi:pyruvate-ferredoxin/flavodoxin oxidoreductase|nr:pyruvate:ferredoxin (flavodoxin) oxidoreductase [Bacillota bacterium]NLO94645.1 pyruvate:ferredoxin (flavodoxin) oxidoreductase [Bacillota bacterium]